MTFLSGLICVLLVGGTLGTLVMAMMSVARGGVGDD